MSTKPKPKSKQKPCGPNFGLPQGVKPHNPDNLTPEQVGEGWRLMAESEIREDRVSDDFIHGWVADGWDPHGWFGIANDTTYRVPADRPLNWDAPRTEPAPQSASTHQEGGDHYKSLVIQPAEFITRNKLSFLEGCAVEHICSHRAKNGAEDIRRAINELKLILELEYPNE